MSSAAVMLDIVISVCVGKSSMVWSTDFLYFLLKLFGANAVNKMRSDPVYGLPLVHKCGKYVAAHSLSHLLSYGWLCL